MRAFLRDTFLIIVLAAVIVAGQRAIAPKIVVSGPSMSDTMHDGQQIVVSKISYKLHAPERGDVIVFYPPNNGKEEYIKRIIGLPGEYIDITEGTVSVHKRDGTILALNEPYVTNKARTPYRSETIPNGEYFVLGDNRINSSDSRAGWTVPFNNIIGKAWLTVWPLDRLGLVENPLATAAN